MDTLTLFLGIFFLFLLALILLDIAMIVSLMRTGDERRQLIVWKASAFTLLSTVGALAIDIVGSIARHEAMQVNPVIKLSVTATVYFLALMYYKKRYGD